MKKIIALLVADFNIFFKINLEILNCLYYLRIINHNKTISKMKQYHELNIDQKINYKANMQNKGMAYGTLPNGWTPMYMDTIRLEVGTCATFDGIYNYGKQYKGGYQIR